MEQESIIAQETVQEISTPEPEPAQELVPETTTPEPVQTQEYQEHTIYDDDALNQGIYETDLSGNIYGVENSDIYGGALDCTIYSTGRAEPEPAPEFVQDVPQVDDREARRAALMAEMEEAREQGRDSQEIER